MHQWIDDWSSQKEVLEANAATGPGEQQTVCQEIRAYWDEQKQNGYKHWRTDAALRGFYTGPRTRPRLKRWDASLKPKRGFLEGSSVFIVMRWLLSGENGMRRSGRARRGCLRSGGRVC